MVNMGSDTDRRNYRVSFIKIRRMLGFTPHWTVEEGVKQVIESLESGKVIDYRDAKYSNVKFLREEGTSRFLRHDGGWAYELINESITVPLTDA